MLLDRRMKKRESLRTIAEYKVFKVPAGLKFKKPANTVKAPLLDISVGGCSLDSPYPIPPGVTISIRIDPLAFAIEASESRKEALEMTGRVTSCNTRSEEHNRLGIQFIKSKSNDIGLIKRFMKSKERRQFPRWDMSRA
jgi:c-di-GMP-binding flagellar brake protein YcgR